MTEMREVWNESLAARNVTADPERFHLTAHQILDDPRVDRTDSCWIWTGSRTARGYGRYNDRYAHRLAYEQAIGPIPDGYEIMHLCDNPPCVNPAHLKAGTHLDNMRDAASKGLLRSPGRGAWKMCGRKLHPLEGDNLYISPRGVRECLACKRERRRQWGLKNGR